MSALAGIKDWYDDQPKSRIFMAALIIVGIGYVIFGFGYGKDYHDQVNRELELARMICETSEEYVQSNPDRLKMGKADLKNLTYDGERIKLKYVKYPKVVFMESGFSNLNKRKTARDVYCFYTDPRDSTANNYYNYETKTWQNKIRFRN